MVRQGSDSRVRQGSDSRVQQGTPLSQPCRTTKLTALPDPTITALLDPTITALPDPTITALPDQYQFQSSPIKGPQGPLGSKGVRECTSVCTSAPSKTVRNVFESLEQKCILQKDQKSYKTLCTEQNTVLEAQLSEARCIAPGASSAPSPGLLAASWPLTQGEGADGSGLGRVGDELPTSPERTNPLPAAQIPVLVHQLSEGPVSSHEDEFPSEQAIPSAAIGRARAFAMCEPGVQLLVLGAAAPPKEAPVDAPEISREIGAGGCPPAAGCAGGYGPTTTATY